MGSLVGIGQCYTFDRNQESCSTVNAPPRVLLGGLEVAVDEGLGFHGVQIGHALGTLQTPAHGVRRRVLRQGLRTVQHCEQSER